MLGRAPCARTRYVELVFLRLVQFVGHVVRLGASVARHMDTLFFRLGWARCRTNRKRTGTCDREHVFLHLVRSIGHVVRLGSSRA
jgi:hypothetical protein